MLCVVFVRYKVLCITEGIFTQHRSVAKNVGCFRRHLFVGVFVGLFVNMITSERVNIG